VNGLHEPGGKSLYSLCTVTYGKGFTDSTEEVCARRSKVFALVLQKTVLEAQTGYRLITKDAS